MGTCVLLSGAAGLCTSSTAVSRRKEGLRDTAGVAGASGAATVARALAALLWPVYQYGLEQDQASTFFDILCLSMQALSHPSEIRSQKLC